MNSGSTDRAGTRMGAWTFGLVASVLAMVALVVAANAKQSSSDAQKLAEQASGIVVELSEFKIAPAVITAPEGATLTVKNVGSVDHNLWIEKTKIASEDVKAGSAATVSLKGLKPGTYTVYCQIAGHRGSGMEASLRIGSSTASGGTDAAAEEAALESSNDEMDAMMAEPVTEYVKQLEDGANTKGVGNQPLEPKILPDGTKQFDITASIIDWEVEPGKTVRAWAYNEQVPGPAISVNSGDKVNIVLHNELPQSTAIHFHGIQTPFESDGVPDVTQPPVKPGDSFTYSFVAKGPAVGMYHSHHHAEKQVPDGLVGTLNIDGVTTPEGTGPVAQRIPMVLNDAGVIGLSLNGKSFPATAPVMAEAGTTVAIDYYNEGLLSHPMHLHGLPQTVVMKDGFPLPVPYQADTINVAPGERYTVLVSPTDEFLATNKDGTKGPGIWAFHCHILTHAEREDGMFGMVTTFIVTPKAA